MVWATTHAWNGWNWVWGLTGTILTVGQRRRSHVNLSVCSLLGDLCSSSPILKPSLLIFFGCWALVWKQRCSFVLIFKNLPGPSCERRFSCFGPVLMIALVIIFKVLVSVEALSYPLRYHESQVAPGCPRWGRQTSQKLFRSLLFQVITRAGKIT